MSYTHFLFDFLAFEEKMMFVCEITFIIVTAVTVRVLNVVPIFERLFERVRKN